MKSKGWDGVWIENYLHKSFLSKREINPHLGQAVIITGYEPKLSSPTVFFASISNDTRCISFGLSVEFKTNSCVMAEDAPLI